VADDLDLRQFEKHLRDEAGQALGQFGELVLGEAQRRAPVREGTLRGAGSSTLVVDRSGASVQIAFSTPYAARQHEETQWDHPKGGEAKYLENAVKTMGPRWPGFLASRLGRLF
jgi:hypothetical protein